MAPRVSVSLVAIMFELTGGLEYILPIMAHGAGHDALLLWHTITVHAATKDTPRYTEMR